MKKVQVKKYLKYAAGGLAAIILVILIAAAMKSDEFSYESSMEMNASRRAVYLQVINLNRWQEWSPWAKLDPNAENIFKGPRAGLGAEMTWKGNGNVGEGSMKIIEAVPHKLIKYQLDFIKPMAGTSISEFNFESIKGGKTLVTWRMTGKAGYWGKVMGIVMNCEGMITNQFNEGLTNIKQIVEK